MSEEKKFEVKLVLSNGKMFNDGEGVDMVAITSLRMVNRFFNIPIPDGIRFKVTDHCFFGSLIIPRYCDYMANNFHNGEYKSTFNNPNFRLSLYESFLTHDLEEFIVGDIPAPIKSIEIENIKNYVRDCVRRFLRVQLPTANVLKVAVKHIDLISAMLEVYEYKDFWHGKNDDINMHLLDYYLPKIDDSEILFEFIKELSSEMYYFYLKMNKNK